MNRRAMTARSEEEAVVRPCGCDELKDADRVSKSTRRSFVGRAAAFGLAIAGIAGARAMPAFGYTVCDCMTDPSFEWHCWVVCNCGDPYYTGCTVMVETRYDCHD